MRLSFFLARRFLFSKHRSGFVRLLTTLSIFSVGLTLASFVIVMAVMNGFDGDLQDRIVSGIGAVRGFGVGGRMAYTAGIEKIILETPGVTAATPELQVSALLRSPGGRMSESATSEAQVTGAALSQKIKTAPLEKQLQASSALPASSEILLGSALAEKLSVEPGDTVDAVLLFPSSPSSIVDRPEAVHATFRVSGIFKTGYYEVDVSSAIAPLAALQELFAAPPELAHSVEIAVAAPGRAADVAANLNERLSKEGIYFRSWREMREPLFRAVALEKRVMALILSLFGLVAVFCVLSALTATAVEKRRELAALRAMGMSRAGVAAVLVTAGAIAGGLGVLLGGALSLTGHLLITSGDLFRLPPDVYDLDRLPSEWSTPLFAGAALVLFSLSLLAACFPAVIQARKAPSEALREE